MSERFDVAIVGAGPAGLSAALNLARSRHRVVVFDSNRPRNAATMASHGFLSRDGISPLELRKLGLAEVLEYPSVSHRRALVEKVTRVGDGFEVVAAGETVAARVLVVASGLREVLPALPSIRSFYGVSLHSCLVCDGFEKRDQPLALIGESDDLAERAVLVSRWSDDLVVFTNGVAPVSQAQEESLAARGIRVERRPVADVVGDRSGLTGVRLADGEVVPRSAGFIRPRYEVALEYLSSLGAAQDASGYLLVDAHGRSSVPWLYAAGDVTPPGPKQLIVAAGAGAMVAGGINRDELLGWRAGA
ncbi:MAG TPA: NAD(P)/FAD-dependent oxidoreductase [Terrimesophilobacter sp.]|nr:NAD(P)/FAD-dependent oxidoreductase [Terrimesophilobacter sp.]